MRVDWPKLLAWFALPWVRAQAEEDGVPCWRAADVAWARWLLQTHDPAAAQRVFGQGTRVDAEELALALIAVWVSAAYGAGEIAVRQEELARWQAWLNRLGAAAAATSVGLPPAGAGRLPSVGGHSHLTTTGDPSRPLPKTLSFTCSLDCLIPIEEGDVRTLAELFPVVLSTAPSHHHSVPLVWQAGAWYLWRHWRDVTTLQAALPQRAAQVPARGAPDDWPARLERWFGTANAEQRQAAQAIATRAFTLITGGPGTGKTYTVARALLLLQEAACAGKLAGDFAPVPLRIALAAPTGKAAARLEETLRQQLAGAPAELRPFLPQRVETLHRLLGVSPHAPAGRFHEYAPLPTDVVVVDEVSMADVALLAQLVRALPAGSRLVLIGDPKQLPSVQAGDVLAELIAWAKESPALAAQWVRLRAPQRFAASSAFAQLALALWQPEGDKIAAQLLAEYRVEHPDKATADLAVWQGVDVAALAAWVASQYQRLGQEWGDDAPSDDEAWQRWAAAQVAQLSRFQLLTPRREGPWGVRALNEAVEATLARTYGWGTEQPWYAGRPVIVTRNDYALGLMNGDVGLTLPRRGRLVVAFAASAGSVRVFRPARLTHVQTVFALTVHKAQGSEYEHVAFVVPPRAGAVMMPQLVYTAITRAKRRCTVVLPPGGG